MVFATLTMASGRRFTAAEAARLIFDEDGSSDLDRADSDIEIQGCSVCFWFVCKLSRPRRVSVTVSVIPSVDYD